MSAKVRLSNIHAIYPGPPIRIRDRMAGRRAVDVPALADVNLVVGGGETVAILGESGCGKTTLLSVIAGLVSAVSGRVHLDGRDVTDLSPHKRNLAMMFQHHSLYPHMSVRTNLAAGRVVDESQRGSIAEYLGISGLMDRMPHEISGGQRRRAALASVLCRRAAVRLIDEPFAGLDRSGEDRLFADLWAARSDGDLAWPTTILVTHRLENAARMADKIAVIHRGRVLQCDTLTTLRSNPVHRRVLEATAADPVVTIARENFARHPEDPAPWILARGHVPDRAASVSFRTTDVEILLRRPGEEISLGGGLLLMPDRVLDAGPERWVLVMGSTRIVVPRIGGGDASPVLTIPGDSLTWSDRDENILPRDGR